MYNVSEKTRGEAKDNSDIDLYIERGKLKSLLQYFAFVDELEIVWNTLVEDIPMLKKNLQKLL